MSTVWNINFENIAEILNSGIRRADIFMGIGLNAADYDPPISHVLSQDGSVVKLVKEEFSAEEKTEAAHEFAKWIRLAGFRELLETLSIYLLRLYEAISYVHQAYGDGSKIMSVSSFEKCGIFVQIVELRKFIPIVDERVEILRTLNQARNCYAHRRGVVSHSDVDDDIGRFTLKWLKLVVEAEEPDGTIISEPDVFGYHFSAGAAVRVRIVIADRSFAVGEELVVGKADLKQICLCIHTIGHAIGEDAMKFALASGAEAIAPAEPPEMKAVSHDDPQ